MGRNMDWNRARPTNLVRENNGEKPTWLVYDDQFVDEVRRALKACQVFLFYPLYWISYNVSRQFGPSATSQS